MVFTSHWDMFHRRRTCPGYRSRGCAGAWLGRRLGAESRRGDLGPALRPRRRRSQWSKRNTVREQRLISEGRMHPAGIAEVEWAKADGRWTTAYDRARTPRYAY